MGMMHQDRSLQAVLIAGCVFIILVSLTFLAYDMVSDSLEHSHATAAERDSNEVIARLDAIIATQRNVLYGLQSFVMTAPPTQESWSTYTRGLFTAGVTTERESAFYGEFEEDRAQIRYRTFFAPRIAPLPERLDQALWKSRAQGDVESTVTDDGRVFLVQVADDGNSSRFVGVEFRITPGTLFRGDEEHGARISDEQGTTIAEEGVVDEGISIMQQVRIGDSMWNVTIFDGDAMAARDLVPGGPLVLAIIGSILSLAAGGFVYWLIIDRDCAKKGESEARDDLQQHKEIVRVLQQVMNQAPIGIVITDPRQKDNPIVYCNPHFERLTGYQSEGVIGKNPRFLHGDDRDQEGLRELKKAIENQQTCSVLLHNYRFDKSAYWARLSIAPVFDEKGMLIRFIGMQEDVTAQKRTDDDLKARKEDLERFQKIAIDRELKMVELKKELDKRKAP